MNKKLINIGMFLSFVLAIAVLNSCKKDVDNNGGSGGGVVSTPTKIVATNVNNGSSEIKTVKVLVWDDVLAEAPYQNNGFTLQLPATVESQYLELISEDLPQGYSVSNRNAKVMNIESITAYDVDDDEIGDFYLEFQGINEGHYVTWFYSDSDVTISGEDDEGKIDLQLKKGWNIVYFSFFEDDSALVTSKKPSGINYTWNFY